MMARRARYSAIRAAITNATIRLPKKGPHWGCSHRQEHVGSTQLASGRFAMIDDGIGLQLVPWQTVLDKRIGQHVVGGRQRGLGL
jgi:Protein of unknown function (DUF3363)